MKDDLISRQTAIKDLERLIKDCNPDHFVGHQKFIEFIDDAEIGSFGDWQFTNGFNIGLTAAEIAIEKLPSAQSKQCWIPISERLPEDDTEVIVSCTDDSGDSEYSYTTVGWHYKGIWVVNNDRSFFVKAWMPLPDPYKE